MFGFLNSIGQLSFSPKRTKSADEGRVADIILECQVHVISDVQGKFAFRTNSAVSYALFIHLEYVFLLNCFCFRVWILLWEADPFSLRTLIYVILRMIA